MNECDVVIVGAGMAGASLAAELASGPLAARRIVLLEAEDQPGLHATGRSAAFWDETYGGPAIQPLTTASGPFLSAPPACFADRGFLRPRGALIVGRANDTQRLHDFERQFARTPVRLDRLDEAALASAVPGIRDDWISAVTVASCCDIDVAGLHMAYLRYARRHGVDVRTRAALLSARRVGNDWHIDTRSGRFRTPLLVNAAGAWADGVARAADVRPIGIAPLRRTLVQLRLKTPVDAALPLIIDVNGRFYLKGEGIGRIWLSPHDEHPSMPGDVAPEELDIAEGIARVEAFADWGTAAVERQWAGLRSFAPDRRPAVGFAAEAPGFFWFAGQGGFGIQTAPAMAAMAGRMLAGSAGLHDGVGADVDAAPYAATRFTA